jgi:hypothetical protein
MCTSEAKCFLFYKNKAAKSRALYAAKAAANAASEAAEAAETVATRLRPGDRAWPVQVSDFDRNTILRELMPETWTMADVKHQVTKVSRNLPSHSHARHWRIGPDHKPALASEALTNDVSIGYAIDSALEPLRESGGDLRLCMVMVQGK